jgi:hypothetical protein
MFARRTIYLALIAALGVTAAGCMVENEYSIVDKPVPADKRLAGAWALEADGGAQVLVLNIGEDNPNAMQASFVIAPKDEPAMTSRATVFFTTIGDRAYFEADWRPGEWLPLDPPVRRAFGTYELTGGPGSEILKVCFADPKSFEAPIKSGALAGFSGKGDDYQRRTVLASDTAATRAFLAKNHFQCSVSSNFRRLTGPAQSR